MCLGGFCSLALSSFGTIFKGKLQVTERVMRAHSLSEPAIWFEASPKDDKAQPTI